MVMVALEQDAKNVYFLTEFLGGGDLFTAIREIGNLSKRQSQCRSFEVWITVSRVLHMALRLKELLACDGNVSAFG